MELKNNSRRKADHGKAKRKVLLIVAALLGLCAVMFFMGAFMHKKGKLNVGFSEIVKANVKIPVQYMESLFVAEEEMQLDIKHEDLQRLAYCRKLSLEAGYLIDSSKEYVPAEVTFQGKKHKIKMRLKGTLPDHWSDEKKWSFRVKVKGEKSVMGMKIFALQHPKTRNYLYEWFAQTMFDDNDILAVRYHFVRLNLNGTDLGIYALEENFDKRIIESNGRREGPILKFGSEKYGAGDNRIEHYGIDVERDPKYQRGIDLLESFRTGKLQPHEVFDTRLMARYFAIADLIDAPHAAASHNIRFYYNPITALIEPIAYDAELFINEHLVREGMIGEYLYHSQEEDRDKINIISSENFHIRLFSDPVFFAAYVKELEKIANGNILESFFERHRAEIDEKLSIIHKSFPQHLFEEDLFYKRKELIQKRLSQKDLLYAFPYKNDLQLLLNFQNASPWPLQIESVSYGGQTFPLEKPFVLDAVLPDSNEDPALKEIAFHWPLTDSLYNYADLKVQYRILGATTVKEVAIQEHKHVSHYNLENDFMRRKPNATEFPFVQVDENKKEIHFHSGNWVLDKDMIIGSGYKVIVRAPFSLDMKNLAKLHSYSKLDFQGTEEDPIRFFSSDSTAQSVNVIRADEWSELNYVSFDNLSNSNVDVWSLPGSVVFYESPVNINHCTFSNNRGGDDCINIFRSNFTLTNSSLINTNADALDLDFSDGDIIACKFTNVGNDAIDISGSKIVVTDVLVDGAEDKGLSAGENSYMKLTNITVRNSAIAVASKDKSRIDSEGLRLEDCYLGFTAFQKKPEFDKGEIYVEAYTGENIKELSLIETNSIFYLNGKLIETNQDRVKEVMYGEGYGKSSK